MAASRAGGSARSPGGAGQRSLVGSALPRSPSTVRTCARCPPGRCWCPAASWAPGCSPAPAPPATRAARCAAAATPSLQRVPETPAAIPSGRHRRGGRKPGVPCSASPARPRRLPPAVRRLLPCQSRAGKTRPLTADTAVIQACKVLLRGGGQFSVELGSPCWAGASLLPSERHVRALPAPSREICCKRWMHLLCIPGTRPLTPYIGAAYAPARHVGII